MGKSAQRMSYRALASTWQCRPLFDADGVAVKGAQVRMREDGVGRELSRRLSKLASGSNILNQTIRGNSQNSNMETIARTLTIGKLLVDGGKGLSLQKGTEAQKAAFLTTKKHAAEIEAKQEKKSYQGTTARHKHLPGKMEAYGQYAQNHANLPSGYYKR